MSAAVPPAASSADEIGCRDRGHWWVMRRLIANQPLRYLASLLVWVTIWSLPVFLGLIAQQFFDGLAGDGGWAVRDVIVATVVWVSGYAVAIVIGIRLHASLMVRARTSVQRAMLAWIFGLPAARPLSESAGEVVSRFRDDTEHVQEAFDFSVDFAGAALSAAFALAVLAATAPRLTIAVVLPVVLSLGLVRALGGRIARYRTTAREATEAVTGFLGETFGAVGALKVAGAEEHVLARLRIVNDERRAMVVRDRTLTAATEAMVDNTANVTLGLVLVLSAGVLVTGGPDGLSVGEIALFTVLVGRITFSAYMAGRFLARLRQAGVSVERMRRMLPGAVAEDLFVHHHLAAPATPPAAARAVARDTSAPLLELSGLASRHPDGSHAVSGIDLQVAEGGLVVVTGRIGSGKTTLVRTAIGLIPKSAGEIRWRGQVLEDPASALVPPLTGYTPQVPRLFAMTLRDNLTFGVQADDAALLRAVSTAALVEDLDDLPEGLSTLIGARGQRLSGGQIQRSAAARMLVSRPQLLVVDDLSSALDAETEAALWEGLFDGEEPTSALVVSHRRPVLLRADEVVLMDGGRIVDRGKAEELLRRSPLFVELWG